MPATNSSTVSAPETSVNAPVLPIVFLVDVDDTLIENDRIQEDLRDHLGRE